MVGSLCQNSSHQSRSNWNMSPSSSNKSRHNSNQSHYRELVVSWSNWNTSQSNYSQWHPAKLDAIQLNMSWCFSDQSYPKQDRRWNADKPSAALDPYIPTWLTTSPANHRPANFWFFFFYIQRKLWKVVQPQVQLMSINQIWSSHSLTLSSTNNHQHYLLG